MAARFSPPVGTRTRVLRSRCLATALLILFVASHSSSQPESPRPLPDELNGVEEGDNFYCFRGYIPCMSGIMQCLKPEQECDGVEDCADGSDEGHRCQFFNCTAAGSVPCPSGRMCANASTGLRAWFIQNEEHFCNGRKECADGSDEDPSFCASFDCNTDSSTALWRRIRCPGGKGGCVQPSGLCDGYVDCVGDGGSDESDEYCKERGCEPSSLADLFQCRSGRCIHRTKVCDGERDCPDGDDEGEFCERRECEAGYVKCGGGDNRTCIYLGLLCDGVEDCPGGTDEAQAVCDQRSCEGGRLCPSGKRCADFDKCNGVKQCPDGSDEDPDFCRTYNCSEPLYLDDEGTTFGDMVKCKDGLTCIPESALCDGRKHCPDKSDEDPVFCREHYNCTVKCPGSEYVWCTAVSTFCDGRRGDCYGDVEESRSFCEAGETIELLGKQGRIKCASDSSSSRYFRWGGYCDGKEDCADGSDEREEFCERYICPEGKVKCYGRACIRGQRCDGKRDCADGTDEEGCSTT